MPKLPIILGAKTKINFLLSKGRLFGFFLLSGDAKDDKTASHADYQVHFIENARSHVDKQGGNGYSEGGVLE